MRTVFKLYFMVTPQLAIRWMIQTTHRLEHYESQ